jgi:uncharacterized membrane protein
MQTAASIELDEPGFHAKHRPAPPPRVNVSPNERVGSIALGTLLALRGWQRGLLRGSLQIALGGALLYRGVTGHSPLYKALGLNTAFRHNTAIGVRAQHGRRTVQSLNIHCGAEELYQFLRNTENWPRFMSRLESVRTPDNKHLHLVVRGLLGRKLEWDVEIFNARENELLAWRSLPGSIIEEAGAIRLEQEPSQRNTRVTVSLKYAPPGGKWAEAVANLLGDGLAQEVEQDLRRLKQLMEAGEAASPTAERITAD